jgi:ribonuclease HII
MDEVGRGALAGPVCVGAVAVIASTPQPPVGLDDSKVLTPTQRADLVPRVREWAAAVALGWASAPEVDSSGIVGALRAAGWRALTELEAGGVGVSGGIVLLDGKHDWLTPPPLTLGEAAGHVPAGDHGRWRTVTLVTADRLAASVAGASVLAKCARDDVMVGLAQHHPGYGWERNKGYGTREHVAAIAALGPCADHRRSWKLVPS